MPSRGVDYTVVNGAATWAQGQLTEVTAGQVLRSSAPATHTCVRAAR